MEKEIFPTQDLLAKYLGEKLTYISQIQNHINNNYGESKEDWQIALSSIGWRIPRNDMAVSFMFESYQANQ